MRECKMVRPPWKTIWQSLIKTNGPLGSIPTIPLSSIYLRPKETKIMFTQKMALSSKTGNKLNVLQQVDWQTRIHINGMWYYFVMKRNTLLLTHKKLEESQMHYTKWMKPDSKSLHIAWFHLYVILEKAKL